MTNPPDTPDLDPVTAALDAADATLRAELVAAERDHQAAADNAWDGLLTLIGAAWAWQPGPPEQTSPIPVEAALTHLNGTARTSIERLTPHMATGDGTPRYVLTPERVRIVEEARIPHFHDDRVRDCVRVNPARYLAARRLLSQTLQRISVAAAVRDHTITEARLRHTETTGPLLVALARQELHHA
jgi:hypothetical protein